MTHWSQVRTFRAISTGLALGGIAAGTSACGSGDEGERAARAGSSAESGQTSFSDPTRIDNPYYPISESGRCELRGRENGDKIEITRELLGETEPFTIGAGTVDAAAVEDREYEDGKIVERVLDYFAQGDDGVVYHLGKDVDNYERGKVANHEGSFRYGHDTDVLGVIMPADPQIGDRWRSEVVSGETIRRHDLVEQLPSVTLRGQRYEDVIRVREQEPPDKEFEFKLYAPGAGIVLELPPGGRVDLVGCA